MSERHVFTATAPATLSPEADEWVYRSIGCDCPFLYQGRREEVSWDEDGNPHRLALYFKEFDGPMCDKGRRWKA